MSRNRVPRAGWLGAVALLLGPVPCAQAEQLDDAACRGARDELALLEGAGVKDHHERGPEWARVNLAPDGIEKVKRWIELNETVLFKCPRPKPQKPVEAAAGGPSGNKSSKPSSSDSAAIGPGQTGTLSETGATGDPAVKPKKKKSAEKKRKVVDDAYIPPAPSGGPELQHTAPGDLGTVIPGAGLAP
ncbi:MAG: hypothetical protein NW216_14720 [Hyphomicrobium sp.]|nr:hypothetical protein [Hyphomicrobium sp.]